MVASRRPNSQSEMEARLAQLATRPVTAGMTLQDAFGDFEDWVLPLAGQELFLDPRDRGWYYYDRASDRPKHTGYHAGEVTFYADGGQVRVGDPLPQAKTTAPAAWYLAPAAGGQAQPLGAETTLGRAEGNQIVLQDGLASRQHAVIRRQGEGYAIEDLGSRNGTLVNGARIGAPTPLRPGDRITIGSLQFVVSAAQAK
jgi:hypothetical protein